ncbi:hypothetical protein SISNIDRAFT_456908 [Sistotremastrum niveocremeum HHB9708]|uniref:DUF1349-domain-containing protein n=1 Tax=Sistotremastrum niveocremeum HHB9708 TaxID=1314777 RepID=A0A164SAH0_9AGAM|nr:hypothetical protein SISNIDRAFT_456908 [Sistotremastrum niveocremeum HHB9708]
MPSLSQLLGTSPTGISLSAPPDTDLWRKPPAHDAHNIVTALETIPFDMFQSARVTVTASWTRLYDQGGLVLYLPASNAEDKEYWVKTGIEFHDEIPNLSTVAAREAADWSLLPLTDGTATIEIAREPIDAKKGTGSSLWVYMIQDGKKVGVREITWVFDKPRSSELRIGVYAARPTVAEGDEEELKVFFTNFTLVGKS